MISVIVPVYNVEKYLAHCIDSIISQTYNDWELLLIDDGSADASGAICDEYSKKDDRISVFHQKNSGVSAARNVGLDHMKGDYLIFLDSDDWIEPDMLAKLYQAMVQYSSDIVACDSYLIKIQENNQFERKQSFKWGALKDNLLVDHDEAFFRVLFQSATLWNKLFRREFVSHERFNIEMSYGEDTDFLVRVMNHGSRTVLIPYAGYNYVINRPGNVQSGGVSPHMIQLLENSALLYKMLCSYGSHAVGVYRLHIMIDKLICKIPINELKNEKYKKYYSICKKYAMYPNLKDKIIFMKDGRFPNSVKRQYIMLCVSPYLRAVYRKKRTNGNADIY